MRLYQGLARRAARSAASCVSSSQTGSTCLARRLSRLSISFWPASATPKPTHSLELASAGGRAWGTSSRNGSTYRLHFRGGGKSAEPVVHPAQSSSASPVDVSDNSL